MRMVGRHPLVLLLFCTFSASDTRQLRSLLDVSVWDGHSFCPTLPGWGQSSPFSHHTLSLAWYACDMAQLLATLGASLRHGWKLWLHLGSSMCCQRSPRREKTQARIAGLVILGGFSPFAEDLEHDQHMTWMNWLTVGPMHNSLGKPLHWLVGRGTKSKQPLNMAHL